MLILLHPLPVEDSAPSAVATIGDWLASLATVILVPAAGAGVGLAAAFVLNIAFRIVSSRSRVLKSLIKRGTAAFLAMFTSWGAWAALIVQDMWAKIISPAKQDLINDAAQEAQALSGYQHLFLIIAIAATTWFAYSLLWVLEDAARIRAEVDGRSSSRFQTQAQVLRRLGQVIVVVVGVGIILFTFPSARQLMGGLLASAGLVSVIAGLAAQSTLSNVIAGLQLAFTDAIRVGDTVVVGPKDQSGVIEEITLAYVVIRIWDERRIVIPSKNFTTSTFENWSRRETQQQGTVELRLDWAAPMAQIRHKVASILASTDLWDGRNWAVHITDSDKDTILVRIVVSARNSSELFELRSMLRERLIDWIMTEEPWVRPAFLLRQQEVEDVKRDLTGEQLARLATELSGIASDATHVGNLSTLPAQASPATTETEDGKQDPAAQSLLAGASAVGNPSAANPNGGLTETQDHAHAARMTASRQKAKKARRRAMAERQRELAQGRRIAGDSQGNPDDLATRVMTAINEPQSNKPNPA